MDKWPRLLDFLQPAAQTRRCKCRSRILDGARYAVRQSPNLNGHYRGLLKNP
jgi:hypothetical protein